MGPNPHDEAQTTPSELGQKESDVIVIANKTVVFLSKTYFLCSE